MKPLIFQRLPSIALGGIVAATAGLPLIWASLTVLGEPRTLLAGLWDARMMSLFAWSTLYAVLAGLGAVMIGLPVAVALGRSPTKAARVLWLVVPLPLLLPSMVTGYGWQQVLHLAHADPVPQSAADIARCIAILATWLWPVPAIVIAMTLRRIDQSLLEQSSLDGVLARTLLRRATAPAVLSFAICVILAMQEYAIFEPTGISVMATEIRMIFETGRLSSAENPIASLVGGVGVAESADLPARAALALAAGVPVLLLTALLCGVSVLLYRTMRFDETIELSRPPSALQAGVGWTIAAWGLVMVAIGVPIAAMFVSLDRPFRPFEVMNELKPQLLTSVTLALVVGAAGVGLACLAAIRSPRWVLLVALAGFLIGGQFTAIALLRLFSTSDLGVRLLDYNVPVALAYLGRFSWIALLAGASLHAGPWRAYREMAGADGASPVQALLEVIVGMGWPVLLLAGVLMGALSLVEVPATALLTPPSIVPMLLTWVHMQRYGPMMEASLILCCIVLVLGWSTTLLWAMMKRRMATNARRQGRR